MPDVTDTASASVVVASTTGEATVTKVVGAGIGDVVSAWADDDECTALEEVTSCESGTGPEHPTPGMAMSYA